MTSVLGRWKVGKLVHQVGAFERIRRCQRKLGASQKSGLTFRTSTDNCRNRNLCANCFYFEISCTSLWHIYVSSIANNSTTDSSTSIPFKMISKFITEVSTVFNPFSPKAKTARLFLSFLPPNARQTMKINTKLLPRMSKEPSFVELKFSKSPSFSMMLYEEALTVRL